MSWNGRPLLSDIGRRDTEILLSWSTGTELFKSVGSSSEESLEMSASDTEEETLNGHCSGGLGTHSSSSLLGILGRWSRNGRPLSCDTGEALPSHHWVISWSWNVWLCMQFDEYPVLHVASLWLDEEIVLKKMKCFI